MQTGTKTLRKVAVLCVMALVMVITLIPATVFAGTVDTVGSTSLQEGGSASGFAAAAKTFATFSAAPEDNGGTGGNTGGTYTVGPDTAEVEEATARTASEYEVPAGSTYIPGAEDQTFDNTHEKNAIQAAIDAALATGQKEINIVVNNGVYEGGIKAVKPASATDEDNYILRLIASDAINDVEAPTITTPGNIHSGSAGGARVTGDIDIDGIS